MTVWIIIFFTTSSVFFTDSNAALSLLCIIHRSVLTTTKMPLRISPFYNCFTSSHKNIFNCRHRWHSTGGNQFFPSSLSSSTTLFISYNCFFTFLNPRKRAVTQLGGKNSTQLLIDVLENPLCTLIILGCLFLMQKENFSRHFFFAFKRFLSLNHILLLCDLMTLKSYFFVKGFFSLIFESQLHIELHNCCCFCFQGSHKIAPRREKSPREK